METKVKRLPPWLVSKTGKGGKLHQLKASLRGNGLHTVCESARCPNIGQCFSRPTATYMILGDVCTRNCGFCNIATGKPSPPNPNEPENLARHAAELKLRHVVVTSVTRDDLQDGGADHFCRTAVALKKALPQATLEVLAPDFQGNEKALAVVVASPIDVFNHNLETVPRLYRTVRPGAVYRRSLDLLKKAKELRPSVLTKSGMMVGLGESLDEVRAVFDDLASAGVDAVTVGQYLRPRLCCLPVVDYIHPTVFEQMEKMAQEAGISYAACAPLVRSSFNAEEFFEKTKR